jgi:hypothetical protein
LESDRGPVDSYFIYRTLLIRAKLVDLIKLKIIGVTEWKVLSCPHQVEGIFSATNMFAQATDSQRLERYAHWVLTRNYALLTGSWLETI